VLDVVEVLESIGADADLARATPADLDAMLRREAVDPTLCAALLEGNLQRLRELLRAPSVVCSLINAPEKEEEDEQDEPQDEEDEDDGDALEPRG
jgi:hypothetical protein